MSTSPIASSTAPDSEPSAAADSHAATMSRPNASNVHLSVFPANPNSTTKQKRKRPTRATVAEHPYGPTAPGANRLTSTPASVPVMTPDPSTIRYAPFGSFEYDLAIRTTDRVAWAQWALDLHKEIRSLRHVQDLGPYTMGVIAMMTEDGVWPTGNSIDLEEEESEKR